LFEKLPEDYYLTKNVKIENAVKEANEFSCEICKHGGPLSTQPPFAKNEKNLRDFIMTKTPK